MKTPFFTYLSFLAILPFLTTLIHSNQHLDQQAQTWVVTYIVQEDGTTRISQYDIQAVANLIYLSWYRSAMTITAQQEMLRILDLIWKGWQNVAQMRLDPSIDQPYSIPSEQQEVTIRFWKLAEHHRSIGITYSYAVKMILEKQILQTPLALDGVADMRDKARKIVLKSLLDIRKQLGEFFHLDTKDQERSKEKLPEQQIITPDIEEPQIVDPDIDLDESKKGINLIDFIYAYIPQLVLHSFIEAYNLQIIVSEEGWHALKTIQEIGNQTWRAIEEARAEFYRVYYKALVNAIKRHGLPDTCLMLMFNKQGIIQTNQQGQLLPEPSKLTLSI